jgi:hypothetical protein
MVGRFSESFAAKLARFQEHKTTIKARKKARQKKRLRKETRIRVADWRKRKKREPEELLKIVRRSMKQW